MNQFEKINMMKSFIQELQNVTLGIFPFITSVFASSPQINRRTEAKLKTKGDRDKFFKAVEYLKKPENKDKTKTIILSDKTKMTISVK